VHKEDGDCDDGGPGSEYLSCSFGTDCDDCGHRDPFSPSPPYPPMLPGGMVEVTTLDQMRAAIAATPPLGSSTIFLAEGTEILLDRYPIVVRAIDLTILSEGTEGATINAQGRSRAFQVEQGARLQLGSLIITGGRFEASMLFGGGAMLLRNSSVTMMDTWVQQSSATAAAGAINVEFGSKLRMANNSVILYCSTNDGNAGAVLLRDNSHFTLDHSSIEDCYSADLGGAVYVVAGVLIVNKSLIARCRSLRLDGGSLMVDGGVTTVTDSRIIGCAARDGGAMRV
jgi:hypothetical protein